MSARYYWRIVIFICMVLHCRFLCFLLRGLCFIHVWGVGVYQLLAVGQLLFHREMWEKLLHILFTNMKMT
jgi:hypothetical protein